MSEIADPVAQSLSGLSFEDALRELETVVRQLESGDVPLDKSIQLYERGEQLRSHCETRLADARARIEAIMLDASGKPTGTRPFDAEGAA